MAEKVCHASLHEARCDVATEQLSGFLLRLAEDTSHHLLLNIVFLDLNQHTLRPPGSWYPTFNLCPALRNGENVLILALRQWRVQPVGVFGVPFRPSVLDSATRHGFTPDVCVGEIGTLGSDLVVDLREVALLLLLAVE